MCRIGAQHGRTPNEDILLPVSLARARPVNIDDRRVTTCKGRLHVRRAGSCRDEAARSPPAIVRHRRVIERGPP